MGIGRLERQTSCSSVVELPVACIMQATGVMQGTRFSWSGKRGRPAGGHLPFGDDIYRAEFWRHFGDVAWNINSLESSVSRVSYICYLTKPFLGEAPTTNVSMELFLTYSQTAFATSDSSSITSYT